MKFQVIHFFKLSCFYLLFVPKPFAIYWEENNSMNEVYIVVEITLQLLVTMQFERTIQLILFEKLYYMSCYSLYTWSHDRCWCDNHFLLIRSCNMLKRFHRPKVTMKVSSITILKGFNNVPSPLVIMCYGVCCCW